MTTEDPARRARPLDEEHLPHAHPPPRGGTRRRRARPDHRGVRGDGHVERAADDRDRGEGVPAPVLAGRQAGRGARGRTAERARSVRGPGDRGRRRGPDPHAHQRAGATTGRDRVRRAGPAGRCSPAGAGAAARHPGERVRLGGRLRPAAHDGRNRQQRRRRGGSADGRGDRRARHRRARRPRRGEPRRPPRRLRRVDAGRRAGRAAAGDVVRRRRPHDLRGDHRVAAGGAPGSRRDLRLERRDPQRRDPRRDHAEPGGHGGADRRRRCEGDQGEELPKVIDTGFFWYDRSNIDSPQIQAVVHQ